MNLFKPCAVFLASAGLAAASLAASAIETKGEGGSVCRPVTPADAAVVSYPQGAVVASAPARVSCALTGSLPGHRQVGAMIAFYSDTRQWKKSQCRFFNAFPSRGHDVAVAGIPGREHIGLAEFHGGKAGFVANAAVCTLYPGQTLYGVDAYFEPH